jgi:hypothetical protein
MNRFLGKNLASLSFDRTWPALKNISGERVTDGIWRASKDFRTKSYVRKIYVLG